MLRLSVKYLKKEKYFMNDPKIELVKSWMTKAKHDLETAKIVSESEKHLLDTAIYHCQQAAEKTIKGFLTFHDIRFEKTHDIVSLLTLALKKNEGLSHFLDRGSYLTPYATEFRYPGDEAMPSKEEFDEALKAAQEIYQYVSSLLPKNSYS